MKRAKIFTILFLVISINCIGQGNDWTYENFESKFISYVPTKKENVSNNNFSYGELVIVETKKNIKNKPENFNYANYWNITNALYALNEKKEIWEISLKKLGESKDGCEYLESFKEQAKFYNDSKELYDYLILKCSSFLNEKEIEFNLSEYVKKNQLDLELVKLIKNVSENDQKFRSADMGKQHEFDFKNQKIIDSLFDNYKTYIGKSLVGDKYQVAMWSVIQHSNIEMMEKYLPIIQNAVKEEELSVVPFKMLIDRVYWINNGFQIFGSQAGVDLADKKTRLEVAEKYGIE